MLREFINVEAYTDFKSSSRTDPTGSNEPHP